MTQRIFKPILYGVCASIALLGLYFAVLSLVSGLECAFGQFSEFWYFIVSLSIGFGIQIGLYFYLKEIIADMHGQGTLLGVTGSTSTAAMISCCTHYLANVLPILGTAGIVTFVSQYQVEIFWAGLAFNMVGIALITNTIFQFKQKTL